MRGGICAALMHPCWYFALLDLVHVMTATIEFMYTMAPSDPTNPIHRILLSLAFMIFPAPASTVVSEPRWENLLKLAGWVSLTRVSDYPGLGCHGKSPVTETAVGHKESL